MVGVGVRVVTPLRLYEYVVNMMNVLYHPWFGALAIIAKLLLGFGWRQTGNLTPLSVPTLKCTVLKY